MNTKRITTEIAQAADAIRAGQLVAVPTETVYGLAGNGLDSLRNLTLACASCNNEAGHLSARQKLDLAMRRRLLAIANELQEIRDELDGRRLPRT